MKSNNAFALTACALFGAGLAHGALIAYYPFDEGAGTTTDNAQGNAALDGVLRPDAGWAAGHTGIALDLTGVATSAVDVTGLTTTFTELTITGWINPDVTPAAWTGIVGSRLNGPNPVGFGFRDTTGQLVYTWNNNSGATWGWVSGLTVPNNEWSYIALTITPAGATAYLGTAGGGLVSATNAIAHIPQAGGDWTIGMDDCCGNVRNFDGQLDDLAIFDHALSPEEHALLFSGAANPLTIPEPSVPSLCVLLGLASLARRRR